MATNTEKRKIQILADGQQVNATFNQMAAAAKLLQNQLRNLPKESEEFAKKSEQLKGIKKNMNELKGDVFGTEKALASMNQEFLQMTPFGPMINTLTSSLGKANAMVKVLTASTNLLKVAIAGTGIGLLVIALGSLITYLTSTQDGIDKVNKVLTPMRVIFEKLQGVVQNLGGNLFKGLGELLNGDLKQGFSTITDGARQAGDELSDAFTEGIEQGGQLAEMNIKIEQTEIELTKQRAILNRQYQEAKEAAQDLSLEDDVRLKAAKEAQDAQNELLDLEQAFIDQKIERMKLEQTFNDTSREDYQELADLEAERTTFEATAAKRRASAKALENTVNREIHAENQKRLKEEIKAEEANAKRIQQLRAEYLKAELELQKQLEDIEIAMMDEGFAKREAQLQLNLEREMLALEQKKEAVLANETLTQEERQAILDQYTELEELKRQENREKLKEAKLEEREADLEERLEQFDEEQEVEILLMENALINAVDAEYRKKEALLEIQREYAMEKLALLEEAGEGESVQALKLKNTIAKIDKEIADNKIAEAQRAEDFKYEIGMMGVEAAQGFLQLGLELMDKESKGRKALANTMKALEAAQVITAGIREVQDIWKTVAKLGPVAGPIVGGIQTGIAVARTGIAVNRIRSTRYAEGGATGFGSTINMVQSAGGTWYMPNGQGTRNVGSFASGGPVRSASFGVIGEAGAEWVGPNWMIRSPKYANLFSYLEAERRRATPFVSGGSTAAQPQIPENSSATADLQQFMAMVEEFSEMRVVMEQIRDGLASWPRTLRVVNDPRDILDGIGVLNEIESDSRINR